MQHPNQSAPMSMNDQVTYLLQSDVQLSHRNWLLCPLRNQHVLDARADFHSCIHRGLQVDNSAAPHTFITGDHDFTLSCEHNTQHTPASSHLVPH